MEKDKSIKSSFWSNLFKNIPEQAEFNQLISSLPPFEDLKRKELNKIFEVLHYRNYTSNEIIFKQGDPGIGLYIIVKGEVEIEYQNLSNHKVTLAHLVQGDFFGELALIDGEKRSASAIAKTECSLAIIFKPDLEELITKYPKEGLSIMLGLSKIIVARLRGLNKDYLALHELISKNSEEINGTVLQKNISTD